MTLINEENDDDIIDDEQIHTGLNESQLLSDSMRKGRGYIVETKSGYGRTYHHEKPLNGKILVYLDSGGKLLCSREKLSIKGFID